MSSEYYYYIIPGDTSSTKVPLTKDELYGLEITLSQKVAKDVQAGNRSARAQRDFSTLMSISYHCLGGNNPCHRSRKRGGQRPKYQIPDHHQIEYLTRFMQELYRMLHKFDRNKGCWTQYVLWARGHATADIVRLEKKQEKYAETLRTFYEYEKIDQETNCEVARSLGEFQ